MKAVDIALKDMLRSLRSAFALVFMFGVPLLVTGMFYFMFGGQAEAGDQVFALPRTRLVVANLDQGDESFRQTASQMGPQAAGLTSLGDVVSHMLQNESLAELLEVSLAVDEAAAYQAVDAQEAAVAVVIPANFTRQFVTPEATAGILLYQDPALSLGPEIVGAVLQRLVQSFSGPKIGATVVLEQYKTAGIPVDEALAANLVAAYLAEPVQGPGLAVQAPPQAPQKSVRESVLGPIMGGMLIFYAFFTGAATGQTILKEDEDGTLPRLFTTPTRRTTILGGKFLAVGLTVMVQVLTLLAAARLIFGIDWGSLATLAPAALGLIVTATTAGIFLNSLLKSTRQSGVVYGGVLTMTGMLGIFPIFMLGVASPSRVMQILPLLVPQGWAVRGLMLSIDGAAAGDANLNLLALLAWSAVMAVVGVWRFQKRYA